VNTYDPRQPPPADVWLALDPDERRMLVETYHRRQKTRLPNAHLHALIHLVVENQLALGVQVVGDTLERLQREGLDRHDAIHAIGSVLAEHLYEVMREHDERAAPTHARYFDQLKQLTAAHWRGG
jgi:hypothetical protein